MLKKAYLEITNVCNLQCSFCRGTTRGKGFMEVERFRAAAEKLRPYTDYLYLHLMGEPLLHPRLEEILRVCGELHFKTVITTNGTLLREKEEILLSCPALYKVSVSLHSFEGNLPDGAIPSPAEYTGSVCAFAKKAAQKGIIVSLRLWNGGGADTLNGTITEVIKASFPGEYKTNRSGLTLAENVYLEYGEKFDWPDLGARERDVHFCMGLRDQIGVLLDGTVVPCCLDADGEIALGNIFTDELGDILASPRAGAIYDGFSRRAAAEELCRKCGYAERFG